jgi:DNA-binding transcriptional MerR regulator/methylmalonyl-CoA mutase cobalamin-binding subunit
MNDRDFDTTLLLGIAAVERDTGIGKDTLRVWERRYGFPQPQRSPSGDRLYPLEQVQRLRLIKRLIDNGRRPAQVVALPLTELMLLARDLGAAAEPPSGEDVVAPVRDVAQSQVAQFIALLKQHDAELLRRRLQQEVMRMGLARFVTELVAPLNVEIGDAWMRGELEVFEEHLYSEIIQRVLRTAIGTIPLGDAEHSRPKIVLTTVPQEPHTLGLLMAEALLALEGCRCVQLGAQMPLGDIAKAVQAHAADVLVLSFSPILPTAQVFEALNELRQRLAPAVQIWVGGSNAALRRRLPAGVVPTLALGDVAQRVRVWREQRSGSASQSA